MPSTSQKSEVVIIGGGPGGYIAGIHAAKLGKQVTIIEQGQLGGVCLHRGCIPSKALISAAHVYTEMQSAKQMGIYAQDFRIDFQETQNWKNQIIDQLHIGITSLMKSHKIEIVQGKASFLSPNEIEVSNATGKRTFLFEDCILATGSRPAQLPHLPMDGQFILSSTELLALQEIPKRLVVIGAGYIGVELGTAYHKLGSQVTMIEAGSAILPQVEPAIRALIERKWEQNKLQSYTETQVTQAEIKNKSVHLTLQSKTEKGMETKKIVADCVLVAVGRVPHTDGMNVLEIGMKLNEKGYILTNKKLQTSVPHIYAIGDVVGEPLLAHKASYQGKLVAEIIAGVSLVEADYTTMPYVIFSDPEIAMVGYTAEQAKKMGYLISVGKYAFQANGRALTRNEKNGFVQIIADQTDGTILGVQMAGPEVSDLIAESGLAIQMGAKVSDMTQTIHAHPTLSEIMMDAAESMRKR